MRLFYTIVFLCFTLYSHAQKQKFTLSGEVYNIENAEKLAGATILLHELKVVSISDDAGNFTLPSIQKGNYTLEVSFAGYTSFVQNIYLNKDSFITISLKPFIAHRQPVVVTGTSFSYRLKSATQAIAVINKKNLDEVSSTNIVDAVAKLVPGVSMLSTGPAISKPIIRGLGFNRMVTLHDGIRQEGQQWGEEHGLEIDEFNIQNIEVLKGPASVMYGSDAMAGVLQLQTYKPIPKNRLRAVVNSVYNSNNRLYALNTQLLAHHNNGLNWSAYATLKSAADYSNAYDGKVFNSRYGEDNVGAHIGINKNWGFSHIILNKVHQTPGIITGNRDGATGKFIVFPNTPQQHIVTEKELNKRSINYPYQDIDHYKITWDNSFSISKGRITTVLSYQQNIRKEFGEEGNSDPEMATNLQTFNYNLTWQLNAQKGFKYAVGLNGMMQQNKLRAGEPIIPDYNLTDAGLFFFTSKEMNAITISAGIRGDIRSLKTKDFFDGSIKKFTETRHQFYNISGTLGASWQLNEAVHLKLNFARGYRAPNMAELFSNGAHEGTARYEYGNPDLTPETSLQSDFGFSINKSHFSFGISAFYNHINGFIFYNKLSSKNGGDSVVIENDKPLTTYAFNQHNAALAGFEINADFHPHPLNWLHFENSFAFVNGWFKNPQQSKYLPFMPPAQFKSQLKSEFTKAGKHLSDLYFKIEMTYTAKQSKIFSAYNTESPTPSYFVFNLAAGTTILQKSKPLFTLNASLNNVFDVAYQNHLSRLKYTDENNVTGRTGVFNMGRNFQIKLTIPIDVRL